MMRVVIKEDFKEKGMSKQDFVRLPKSRFLSKKSCIQKHGRTTQFGQHSPTKFRTCVLMVGAEIGPEREMQHSDHEVVRNLNLGD